MRFSGVRGWVGTAVVLLAAGCGASESAVTPQSGAGSGSGFGARGEWVRLPDAPLTARHGAAGVWLDGQFVVLGGSSDPPCPPNADCAPAPARRDGASFDPVTGRWTRIADAPVPLSGLNAVVAGDRIYVLTADQARPGTFLSYDPDRDTWTKHPGPPVSGGLVAAGSAVLAVPDSDQQQTAVDARFDGKTNSWQRLPEDPLGPSFDRSATWVDGTLLLAAKKLVPNPGANGPALVRLARLDADLSRWTTLPDSQLIGWGPVTVGTRVVWPATGSADGGEVNNWGRSYPEGGIFEPSTGSWQDLPRPSWEPELACCAAVVGHRVLVGGHLLDPATRRWTRVPQLPGGSRGGPAVIGGPDALLVWGGATSGNQPDNLATGYLLRPE